jgi:hypothetical protein
LPLRLDAEVHAAITLNDSTGLSNPTTVWEAGQNRLFFPQRRRAWRGAFVRTDCSATSAGKTPSEFFVVQRRGLIVRKRRCRKNTWCRVKA